MIIADHVWVEAHLTMGARIQKFLDAHLVLWLSQNLSFKNPQSSEDYSWYHFDSQIELFISLDKVK